MASEARLGLLLYIRGDLFVLLPGARGSRFRFGLGGAALDNLLEIFAARARQRFDQLQGLEKLHGSMIGHSCVDLDESVTNSARYAW